MIRFLADENLNNQIVRGVLRRNPNIDIVRVQDIGLSQADDPTVLEWAAQNGCVVLTHDVATMTDMSGHSTYAQSDRKVMDFKIRAIAGRHIV
jgi:predicted nuclease of predicted toxin-antitoxin system